MRQPVLPWVEQQRDWLVKRNITMKGYVYIVQNRKKKKVNLCYVLLAVLLFHHPCTHWLRTCLWQPTATFSASCSRLICLVNRPQF